MNSEDPSLPPNSREAFSQFIPPTVNPIFAARRYASAVYAVIVCPSVHLSQVGVLPRRINLGSRKQRHTIAQGL